MAALCHLSLGAKAAEQTGSSEAALSTARSGMLARGPIAHRQMPCTTEIDRTALSRAPARQSADPPLELTSTAARPACAVLPVERLCDLETVECQLASLDRLLPGCTDH